MAKKRLPAPAVKPTPRPAPVPRPAPQAAPDGPQTAPAPVPAPEVVPAPQASVDVPRPVPAAPLQTTKTCGNCACFLMTDQSTGKGKCKFMPPASVADRRATREDVEGERWPICWSDEWCWQWESIR